MSKRIIERLENLIWAMRDEHQKVVFITVLEEILKDLRSLTPSQEEVEIDKRISENFGEDIKKYKKIEKRNRCKECGHIKSLTGFVRDLISSK